MNPTQQLDTKMLVPSDLGELSDLEFRRVVDADLRRRVDPSGLSEQVAAALRSEAHVNRWHATLLAMCRSVEGQLAAGANEFEARRSDIESEIDRLNNSSHGDASRVSELSVLLAELRSTYLTKRASTERFRTGLNEHLILAERLLPVHRSRCARRVRRLEQAIERHREAVSRDLGADDPVRFDADLWAALDFLDD